VPPAEIAGQQATQSDSKASLDVIREKPAAKVDKTSSAVPVDDYASDHSSGMVSNGTEEFTQRLEEIITQLSDMLKGTMRTYGKSEAPEAARAWWYVAARPGLFFSGKSYAISQRGAAKWTSGCLGWWSSADAFMQGQNPVGSLSLGTITGIVNEESDPTMVTVAVALSRESQAAEFVVDNTQLKSTTPGLTYCTSKSLDDEDEEPFEAQFGTCVSGIDEQDGWLRVGDRFLPVNSGGKTVLRKQEDRVFQFRSWKDAKTWASTLAALVEQLHDEY
jgi:hypothetical protein